jgi:hypothetical protein
MNQRAKDGLYQQQEKTPEDMEDPRRRSRTIARFYATTARS